MNPRRLFLTAAGFVISGGCVLAATAPAITATADAFVSAANPGNNYGQAGALEISAAGSPTGEFDTFLGFNLASTKAYFDGVFGVGNWTVQAVSIKLTTTNPAGNPLFNANAAGSIGVDLLQSANADAWVEGAGTPQTPDKSAASLNYTNHGNYLSAAVDQSLGSLAFTGRTSGANIYPLAASSGLASEIASGSDANLYLAAGSGVSALFNSKDYTKDTVSQPMLIVTAVPEPVAPFTLLLGLAALGRRVRAPRHEGV